jgi:hypothetical protein
VLEENGQLPPERFLLHKIYLGFAEGCEDRANAIETTPYRNRANYLASIARLAFYRRSKPFGRPFVE